jgi:hypothetical protein
MNMDIAMVDQKKRARPADLMQTTPTLSARNGRILRAIAGLAVGVLGSIAITHTAAYQVKSQNAGLAHSLAPYDGRITALAGAYLSGPEASFADRSAGDALARQALQQDPTAVVAASTIGLNAQVGDRVPVARRLFTYAAFLSRREIQTQLWAIEDAVGRGSVVDALYHYDIVLRVKPILSQLLFPPLASASTDPEVRPLLTKVLARKPLWGPGFIAHASTQNSDPKSTAQLFMDLRAAGVIIPNESQAVLIKTLLDARFVDEAWTFYTTLRANIDRRKSRDPYFLGGVETPTPFDWNVALGDGVSATIQRSTNRGSLDFTAPSMIGGLVVQQIQVLTVGRYVLKGHSIGNELYIGQGPYWSLICQGGKEIGRVDIPRSDQGAGSFSGMLSVPSECPVQTLTLVARPTADIRGLSGQIDYLQIEPEI